jgi:glycosyltransferase involved in cell wall biosynthesis
MHILHIIATISPEAGGPSDFVRALIEYAPPGYTSEVLTQDDPAAPFILNFPYPIHAIGPATSVYGYDPRLLIWLRANRHRFDGVMLNGLWVYCGYATWRAFAGHKPYLVFSHGMLDPYFKKAYPLKHLKKWVYWLAAEFWVLRGAYRMLFTTDAEAALAEQTFWLHQWNGVVVPFGANRPPASAHTLQEAFYALHPDLRGKRLLLFLGRIHRKKGCDMLIDAFCRLAPLDPGLHLVMAGPDQQGWVPELQQAVTAAGLTDRVHWPGMLRGDAKWGAFFASEAFILPSHQENFGIAVAEAMACGLPVLLADKVNIAPDIAAAGAGLMQQDTQSGTDALLRQWIEMPPADRAQMSQRALALFDDRYDIRKATATIFHLFAEKNSKLTTPKL